MTQEEKELLIRDLCGRLTYGVKASSPASHLEINTIDGYFVDGDGRKMFHLSEPDFWQTVDNFQYYLRPLSSMTEEEKNIIRHKFCFGWNYEEEDVWNFFNHHMIYAVDAELLVDFCNAHHFDYRTDPFTGKTLIESGLAIEAPKGMYEIK